MPKRPSKSDPSLFAKSVFDHIIEKYDPAAKSAVVMDSAIEDKPQKNPAAVALGKLGGRKGGLARAAKLSPTKRKAIAKKAAKARCELTLYLNGVLIQVIDAENLSESNRLKIPPAH